MQLGRPVLNLSHYAHILWYGNNILSSLDQVVWILNVTFHWTMPHGKLFLFNYKYKFLLVSASIRI